MPAVKAVTKPVAEPIDATAGAELVHEPPVVVLDHKAVEPIHKGVVPVMVWATCVPTVMVTLPHPADQHPEAL